MGIGSVRSPSGRDIDSERVDSEEGAAVDKFLRDSVQSTRDFLVTFLVLTEVRGDTAVLVLRICNREIGSKRARMATQTSPITG